MKGLTQTQLNKWLDRMAQDLTLVAPVNSQGKLSYQKIANSSVVAWGFTRTDISPKTWVLPMTETLFTVTTGTETSIQDPPAPAKTVVFGVRPCDARGLMAMDALFIDKAPSDSSFTRHRQATTLIGLACPQMWDSCFCTVVGGAPNGKQGLDILLTEIEGGYAFEAITDKGKELARGLQLEEIKVSIPEPKLIEGMPTLSPSKEWRDKFDDLYWQQVSETCLSCRTCSFVCPTCRCFDVRDEVKSLQPDVRVFERLRAWDACTSLSYRRIAGGHNPRPTQKERLKNRFYCKFMYYPDDFGPLGCVGCGRCIEACPAGISILETIARVEALTKTTQPVEKG
jgi:sulfhydrogenase subunit beta (sulfur reductase)